MDTRIDTKYVLASALVVFLVGFAAWQFGYRQGYDAAKDVVIQSGLLPIQSYGSVPMTTMSGEVESVSGQSITMKVIATDPFAPDSLKTRVVDTDSATVIERAIPKDAVQYKKEMDVFNAQMNINVTGGGAIPSASYPEPYIREEIALADIKEGDRITVSSDGDISTAARFTATKVTVQSNTIPSPEAPAVPRI